MIKKFKSRKLKKSIKWFFSWRVFSRFLMVLEALAIMTSAGVILQIPRQIEEWKNSQSNRTFDQLIKLDNVLNEETNRRLTITIDKNEKILVKNGGKFSEDELDSYLNDLYSIYFAYARGIIDSDDVYSWFSNTLTNVIGNNEIVTYLNDVRKEDSAFYQGFEEFVVEINIK